MAKSHPMDWVCHDITGKEALFMCEQLWKSLPEDIQQEQRYIILKALVDTAAKDKEWNPDG